MMQVSTVFDAGAIDVVAIEGDRIDVNIRRDDTTDPACDFRQWFHFRAAGVRGRALELRFLNAGQCTYAEGWRNYRVCASYDTEHWFRIDTQFDGTVMTAQLACVHDSVYFAYFEPYSFARHQRLLGFAQVHGGAQLQTLARTPDGHDLDLVMLGREDAPPVWIIARQHPGESMAEWFIEGFIERLIDPSDSLARVALQQARFYIVPNMNPDGAVRGNLRASGTGSNLNREWLDPDVSRAPEVVAVRRAMHASGCAFFLDVHGDEGLPYVFVAGSEMLPSYSARQAQLQATFCEQFKRAAPDFQTAFGYSASKYQADALKLASKWVGHTFGCLSLTLEMPFKDNANLPDDNVGWDGARSKALGAAALAPIVAVLLAEGPSS